MGNIIVNRLLLLMRGCVWRGRIHVGVDTVEWFIDCVRATEATGIRQGLSFISRSHLDKTRHRLSPASALFTAESTRAEDRRTRACARFLRSA